MDLGSTTTPLTNANRSKKTAGVLAALDKKIETVTLEEKRLKHTAEQHEIQREATISEIQAKSKKGQQGGQGKMNDKENADDVMELDDMPNSGGAGVLGMLGLGGKRNKWVFMESYPCWILTIIKTSIQWNR